MERVQKKADKNPVATSNHSLQQDGIKASFQFKDNRPEALAQQSMQSLADHSSIQLKQTGSNQVHPVKKKNTTGMPDHLKSGVENLSGIDMSDVKVHYNSSQPAQLNAHAYAQGTNIHVARGQEKHLPHEAWHVVQQKQGRVKPTMQMKKGIAVNDDVGLEKEADVMGAKAMQTVQAKPIHSTANKATSIVQKYDKENFNKIKNIVDSYSTRQELISNVDNAATFNQKISDLKAYKELTAEEKNMVLTQVKMKIKHITMDAVEPEDKDDIKKNFNALKSCVITALLYAEGGSVLGTSSVEGLHYILYTQFPKWRQYSDDAVLAQMYRTFGYQTAVVAEQARHTLVTTQNRGRGMTASAGGGGLAGHMVGFKKDALTYKFKDNDHGEATMDNHATKNQQVNQIWWK